MKTQFHGKGRLSSLLKRVTCPAPQEEVNTASVNSSQYLVLILQPVADVVLNLMTACTVSPSGKERLVLSSAQGAPQTVISFDAQRLAATIDAIALDNAELQKNWGSRIYRIQLKTIAPSAEGQLTLRIA